MHVSNGWNEGRRIVELDGRCNDKGRCTAAGVTCHYIYPIQLVRGKKRSSTTIQLRFYFADFFIQKYNNLSVYILPQILCQLRFHKGRGILH